MKPTVEIIPFGKHKGKPLEVLRSDPEYCDWLTAQGWFREKHDAIYQLIINNFGEPTETPEHNRLQVKFLDRTFCLQLFHKLGWEPVADKNNLVCKLQQKLDEFRHELATCKDKPYPHNKPDDWQWQIKDYESFLVPFVDMQIDEIEVIHDFEHCGWDVKIVSKLPSFAKNISDYRGLERLYHVSCAIEVKAEIGDNYPAILRQMKANEKSYKATYRVLVFDKFTATGANLEQVKQIFQASGFHVLSFSEICAGITSV
ncbi:hypothetical protein LJC36_01690 [Desulfovibrio sp. OttesenSCG-928-C14]|nr:hypothetical protein [Desulfovibrio sp. OttesenSCG-928-C14]